MSIEEFRELQKQVGRQYVNQITKDISSIRQQAECMVENATNIQGQGYSAFIESRDIFMKNLDQIEKDYLTIFNIIPTSTPFD